jgi:predicted RNA-binding Zn ribbon-like protein
VTNESTGVVPFARIGGHPAVDLVNTVDWRLDIRRRSERLASFTDVVTWCADMRLITEAEASSLNEMAERHPRVSTDEWRSALTLREHAYHAMIDADVAAAAAVAAAYREDIDQARLIHSGVRTWSWAEARLTLSTPRYRVARAIVELLTGPDISQLHQCEDEACGWVFLDTSPRRNRRWCVSAECGNRNRVRRHYQRRTDRSRSRQ